MAQHTTLDGAMVSGDRDERINLRSIFRSRGADDWLSARIPLTIPFWYRLPLVFQVASIRRTSSPGLVLFESPSLMIGTS